MDIDKLFTKCEEEIKEEFNKIDKICEKNSEKVLKAFFWPWHGAIILICSTIPASVNS